MTVRFAPIAIIGRSCVLPDALRVDELWTNVAAGRDSTSEVPADRWAVRPELILRAPDERDADRSWSNRGGYVRGFEDVFDPDGFIIPASELRPLDPLKLWLLHCGREALREAGVAVGDERLARAGAVVGNLSFPSSSMSRFAERTWIEESLGAEAAEAAGVAESDPRNRFMSGRPAHTLANALGLGRGGVALDAACASSLYAIKIACDRLHDGSADLMLAGAVNRSDDLFIHVGFCALGAISRVGRSRPFDQSADGLVPAEGAGLVVLKRLEDAVRDGDRILGVIRGVGLSNDGRARSFLAPAVEGQVRAMRSAWDMAGLDPTRVSLIECHATGTPVGDSAEVQSMSEVFSGGKGIPIASLKSNLGHLITSAGVAGLLKVLASFEHGKRAPSIGVDAPIEPLAGSPFRLLRETEAWDVEGARIAAISAFGFGGNNAHLVVEEYADHSVSLPVSEPEPKAVVAVVGLALRAAGVDTPAAFLNGLEANDGTPRASDGRIDAVEIGLRGLTFPPRDLDASLGQQQLILRTATDAVDGLAERDRDRVSVLIGMGADNEVARYGARWRIPEWVERWKESGLDVPDDWRDAAMSAAIDSLTSAGVLGTMPNIPANRLNRQFDAAGPSYTVSGEELSGLDALEIGLRAVATGEIDRAVVGSVDLSCEGVHKKAAVAVLGNDALPAGDAAIVLVLEREDVARGAGHPIFAILEPYDGQGAATPRTVAKTYGHAHAASGLLELGAAVARIADGRADHAEVAASAASGGALAFAAYAPTGRDAAERDQLRKRLRRIPTSDGPSLTFQLHPEPVELPSLPSPPAATPAPDPASAPSSMNDNIRPRAVATNNPTRPTGAVARVQMMEPAPSLPSVSTPASNLGIPLRAMASQPVETPPVVSDSKPLPRHTPTAEASASVRQDKPHAPDVSRLAQPTPPPMPGVDTVEWIDSACAPDDVYYRMAEMQVAFTDAHRAFLERSSEIQQRFIEVHQRAQLAMLHAWQHGLHPEALHPTAQHVLSGPAAEAHVSQGFEQEPTESWTSSSRASETAFRDVDEAPDAPTALVVPPNPTDRKSDTSPNTRRKKKHTREVFEVRRPTAPTLALSAVQRDPQPEYPGPKFTRRDLEYLSHGEISRLFGPEFKPQDEHALQVRMPEPPMLLADRVLGIDAEPASMKKGTIWTETDIQEQSWYLNDGYMPAGFLIESGQADLLLISYLGIDLLLKGERSYRLLGCELTYHGHLPSPGDTLHYEIKVDGHARQGGIRMFFFHYSCTVNGRPQLTVKEGQAGFFNRKELDESNGVIWSPETGEYDATARLDPPKVLTKRRSFTKEQIEAFGRGRVLECFGPGFELTETHTMTPKIPSGDLCLVEKIDEFDPTGGPWGRGYLKSVDPIDPDDWFFKGHFHNDECMPGTLMFEGCLQMMAFYLTAMGYTIDKDGWHFEPVPEVPYKLICRGQVIPESKELTYEVFVEEVHDGPHPTLFADILCTVDGLKAFHCHRMGVRLVPDWPHRTRHAKMESALEIGRVAHIGDMPTGYDSMLACAYGKPSDAFGQPYSRFNDGLMRVPRLPTPPYLFMSRVSEIVGDVGGMRAGSSIVAEYDIPEDAWYFSEYGTPTMPYCVLMEAGLQPCGWLASFVGGALAVDQEVCFRNLDGTATLHKEIRPGAGTFLTRVKNTSVSKQGATTIVSFEVVGELDGEKIYDLNTVFGFFPPKALENQIGIPVSDEDRHLFDAESEIHFELEDRVGRYGDKPALSSDMLFMIDRVSGYWPSGGTAGHGAIRATKDVNVSEWFFKSHFFQDPVMPGSLGIEAMLDLLQVLMLEKGMHEGMKNPRFEPVRIGVEHVWKYRGQVIPQRELMTVTMELMAHGTDNSGRYAVARAALWADGLKIYETKNLGMRLVEAKDDEPAFERQASPAVATLASMAESGMLDASVSGIPVDVLGEEPAEKPAGPVTEASADPTPSDDGAGPADDVDPAAAAPVSDISDEEGNEVAVAPVDPPAEDAAATTTPALRPRAGEPFELSLENAAWLGDHRPTWQRAALPMMVALDWLALAAAEERGHGVVTEITDARMHRWIAVPDGESLRVQIRTEVIDDDAVRAMLELWRAAPRAELSRFELAAEAVVRFGREYPEAPAALPVLASSPEDDILTAAELYESGRLFHGPAFRSTTLLRLSSAGSSGSIDVARDGVPKGIVRGGLLDAATHAIPHDDLHRWAQDVAPWEVAYPYRVESARFFGPPPEAGDLRCEARHEGPGESERFIQFHVQLIEGDRVWCDLQITEVLLPKGPIGSALPGPRLAYLRDRAFVEGIRLSRANGDVTELVKSVVGASDWLPGTIADIYGFSERSTNREELVAIKEHVASITQVHPSRVHVAADRSYAISDAQPLTRFPVRVTDEGGSIIVSNDGPPSLDLEPVQTYWRERFDIGHWPVEDLYYGLCEHFLRRVVVEDPAAFEAIAGRPVLYLANHQVGIESLLFAVVASGISRVPTLTVAKAEHKTSYLGRIINHNFSYPGIDDPGVITFFDRDDREELLRIIGELAKDLTVRQKSVQVHIEGTRALSARHVVQKMSSAFIELALKTNAPIVPIRLTGGLPVEEMEQRIEFPWRYGKQDYWFGRPILPEELEALPLKERKDRVIGAINGLGPAPEDEEPVGRDAALQAEVETWQRATGADPEHSTFLRVLTRVADPCPDTQRIVHAAARGTLRVDKSERDQWLAELARRMFGPRGPRIVEEG